MNDVKTRLRELMEARGMSLRAASRAMGISSGRLSQWLRGTYTGNVEVVDEAVKSFLQRQAEMVITPKALIPFILTTIAKKIFEIARLCHLDGEIGVICGIAGLGKTHAAKQYAAQNPDVVLIEADLGHTAKVLFAELHKALGFDGLGTVKAMFDDIVAKLKGSGRLIIIDEAEQLNYKGLELLRRVHDKAGVGILLVGMPRLISNLRGKRGEFAQLYSRVGVYARLEPLKDEDVQSIVGASIPSSNGLWKAFKEASGGNTRTLSKLLLRSTRIAELNGQAVTSDIVRQTATMLIV